MDPDPGLTIVLLGNTGVGKSASGNTILGRAAFESKRSFRSVTTEISKQNETVFGKKISVVDTPGIFGCERKIQTWCQENLQPFRPHLFLIVVKIDRFTTEQNNAVDAALRVIGDDKLNCYLLFTGGDNLNDMTLDDFINENPEAALIHLAGKFERRLHVFNNDTGGPEQVRELLEKSGHLRNTAHPNTVNKMVLLGLPGVGKSSSGNTILGSDQFEFAGSFDSVTTKTVSKSATVEGRQVSVVDTPGVTDDVLTPRQLYMEIMKSVVESSPGPHAFIIVVRLGRITEADIKLFELLLRLFGTDAFKYAIVLFTYGDELKSRSIDDLIKSNRYVSKLVSTCAGRYCVFDNSKRGNRVQVRDILDKIDEMVTANGGGHYTSEMFRKIQTGMMYFYVKWDEACEWFVQLIKEIKTFLKSLMHTETAVNLLM